MLKVLIVDYNSSILEEVLYCINWEKHGFSITGMVDKTELAIEFAKEFRPEIIITGINMTNIDGMSFYTEVLNILPLTKFIVLNNENNSFTENNELDLINFEIIARKMISLELPKVVIRTRDLIIKNTSKEKFFNKTNELLKKNSNRIIENQFKNIINGVNPKKSINNIENLGMKFKNNFFQIAIIKNCSNELYSLKATENTVNKIKLKKAVEKCTNHLDDIFVFYNISEHIVIFNNNNDIELTKIFVNIKNCILQDTLCIGVGNIYDDFKFLKTSHDEATEALKYRFVFKKNSIINFKDLDCLEAISIKNIEKNIEQFGVLLRELRFDDVLNLIEKNYHEMATLECSIEQAILIAIQFIIKLEVALSEMKIDGLVMKKSQQEIITDIFRLDSLYSMKIFLDNIICNTIELINNELNDKKKDLVVNVKEYLESNFNDENITLMSISKQFFVNSTYLSRIFKEKTGKTFSGYLFELRLEKAKLLLRQSDLRAYEVADRVGIKDSHYFSACFRKYTGMSISEFKSIQKSSSVSIY